MVAKVERPLRQKSISQPEAPAVVKRPSAPDPFPYGWRIVSKPSPQGEVIDYLPLTAADFLDPQLGDQMVQSDKHFQLVKSLHSRFAKRYLHDPTTGVLSDVKILWGIPGLKEPAPDLAVIPNLRTKGEEHSSFDVAKEGTRPILIVEVVSPRYPGDDTTKVEIYQRAGVQEYMIINPHFENDNLDLELIGYRLVGQRYQKMIPDRQGRLLSTATGVWFALDASKRQLILTAANTGERYLTDEEEYDARLVAEAQVEAEIQARLTAEAEIARLKALLAGRGDSQR